MAKKDALGSKMAELKAKKSIEAGTPEDQQQIVTELDNAEKSMAKIKLRPFHYSHQGSLAYVLHIQ